MFVPKLCDDLSFEKNRSWDYPKNLGLDRKGKTWFFAFLYVYVSWIERDKILISEVSSPKFRYFAEQNGPTGRPHEYEFWQISKAKISFLNSYGLTGRCKNGVVCLVLKLSKIVSFLQFFADVSKDLSLL